MRPGDPGYYYTKPLDRKSASGHGSDLGVATSESLRFLSDAIRQYNVTSMIDVPCGDANW